MSSDAWLQGIRANERARGVDHRRLACRASELTPHVRDRLAHAAEALEGIYAELPSLLVPDEGQRTYWESGREAYVARVAEVIRNLGSALTAVGCTDEELSTLLTARTADATVASTPPEDASCKNSVAESQDDTERTVTVRVLSEIGSGAGSSSK